MVKRLDESISSDLPTIAESERTLGQGGIVALITSKLVEIAKMINVGKALTEQQALFAAQMIVERHSDLRPTDVSLFAKKFVCGDYGTFYDKLDVQTILDAMTKYDIERTNQIIVLREQENNRLKQEELEKPKEPLSPERMAQLDELRKSFGKPKEKHPDFGNRPVVPPPTKQ